MDTLVAQIVENFKAECSTKITDSADLFFLEGNLLELLMKLGPAAMCQIFQGIGAGYEGAVVKKEGIKYRFVSYRQTVLHGLFGMLEYTRAYYHSKQGGGYFPLDETLGIDKRHTPGCQYFLTSFTGERGVSREPESVS